MKLAKLGSMPVFWRLVWGYGAILLLSICGSTYSIVQLDHLSGTARTLLNTETRMIANQERLTDAVLSEVRYGAKYVVTQSAGDYHQAYEFHKETTRYLSELKVLARSTEIGARVSRVERMHLHYRNLFDQEAKYIRSRQGYATSRFQEERDKLLEQLLLELEGIKDQLQTRLNEKLESVDLLAQTARQIVIATTLFLFCLGVWLSIKFSRSLTAPLQELQRRTESDSFDAHEGEATSARPWEMQELFEALKREKTKRREADDSNVERIDKFTEDLAARLVSFKKQICDFILDAQRSNRSGSLSADSILNEADLLIRHCSELPASLSAHREVNALRAQATPAAEGSLAAALPPTDRLDELPAPNEADGSNNLIGHWRTGVVGYTTLYKKLTTWKGR